MGARGVKSLRMSFVEGWFQCPQNEREQETELEEGGREKGPLLMNF